MFRSLVAFFTAFCLLATTACTSMRPVLPASRAGWRELVNVGDEVNVSATNGKTYRLRLTVVDDEKIVGVGDKKTVAIRYEQIKTMQVREVSAGKTAGLVGGTLVAVYVILGLAAIYAFAQFGKAFGGD